MTEIIIAVKDESKMAFLLELLGYFDFLEIQKPEKTSKLEFKFGSGKGLIGPIPDDFNEPLEDFKDYM